MPSFSKQTFGGKSVSGGSLSPRKSRGNTAQVNSYFSDASAITYIVGYMLQAGGGGGGANYAGGGGGGGLRSTVSATGRGGSLETEIPVLSGSYLLTVGAGGVWGGGYSGSYGGNSVFGDIIALGGGGGRNGSGSTRGINGCGAGGSNDNGWAGHFGTLGQGYDGGVGNSSFTPTLSGGGGGGTGGNGGSGVNGSPTVGGGEGSPTTVTFTGYGGVSYGAGGQGSVYASGTMGYSRGANTGHGGGSGSNFTNWIGGNGGSGIVLIRYADSLPDLAAIGAGLTKDGGGLTPSTTSGGYKVYRFTAGSDIITFA
jgi:hypothetical protein